MADPIIKKGSTGPAVKKAQQNLIIRHYFPLTDDGVFGPVTRARVIQYQSDRSAGESRAFSCFKRPFQGSVQVVPGRASTLSIRKSWLNLRKRFGTTRWTCISRSTQTMFQPVDGRPAERYEDAVGWQSSFRWRLALVQRGTHKLFT
jgi:peptidoglycan hydrolase-like protein with peptidoglycan-binding domain